MMLHDDRRIDPDFQGVPPHEHEHRSTVDLDRAGDRILADLRAFLADYTVEELRAFARNTSLMDLFELFCLPYEDLIPAKETA